MRSLNPSRFLFLTIRAMAGAVSRSTHHTAIQPFYDPFSFFFFFFLFYFLSILPRRRKLVCLSLFSLLMLIVFFFLLLSILIETLRQGTATIRQELFPHP